MAAPVTFETFQQELARLVARFDREHAYFTNPDYNEAMVRADFLDPFFRALGWDVGNAKGLIHTEREVDIEVRTALSGRQTRADYVFRVTRVERFTCEAKKPAETLHAGHIYQAKRDAFARGIPVAVLSDFEELKIYIVGSRPRLSEPKVGEYKTLHFLEYLGAARELWNLLAYENVAAGSIDRLIDSLPKRALKVRGRPGYIYKPDRTKSLDADFLNLLDEARRALGSDLLKYNDRADLLTGHRLNEAAQRIIDRLVFLRICEDRGIDTGGLLESLLNGWLRERRTPFKVRRDTSQSRLAIQGNGVHEDPGAYGLGSRAQPAEGGLYRELVEHVRSLDQRPPSYKPFFNGQLFKPHFSEELIVGDDFLANFIDELTDDERGYNFADIKVEILGSAYERFLGNVLLPQGRGVKIEKKPEVRKAGGVYYTPRYIVDYIVEQTVARQLAGKSPKEVAKLRFLDPACGSGSFLLRVYERVMEHYLRWFMDNPEKRTKADCYLDAVGNVRLTTQLKRRILLDNVYGVDLDSQAVEVTQLSLYLKMLEGENRESLRAQTELFSKEPLLPSLDKNILCGNSLIASDFSLELPELGRVNAFDWDIGFEKIMAAGGFDAVVGNPPYGAELSEADSFYLKERYKCAEYQIDTYPLFAERAKLLMKTNACMGMIIPSAWVASEYNIEFRRLLHDELPPSKIVVAPRNVFQDATVETVILINSKTAPKSGTIAIERWDLNPRKNYDLQFTRISSNEALIFPIYREPDVDLLITKLAATGRKFREVSEAVWGIKVYQRGKGKPSQKGPESTSRCFHSAEKNKASHRKLIGGSEVRRYTIDWSGGWVDYGPWLAEPRSPDWFQGDRILIREVTANGNIQAAYTDDSFVFSNSVDGLRLKSKSTVALQVVLALLCSKLISFYNKNTSANAFKGTFPKVLIKDLLAFPLPENLDRKSHDRLVSLVDKMLTLKPATHTAKTDTERNALQNAIRKTDRDIDQLVYQLYGLTPEEIALVEGTAEAPAESAE